MATCDDETFWAQREALTTIGRVRVPYQRLQSVTDHVQPDNDHAVAMVSAALDGGNGWVRLNNMPANTIFSTELEPRYLPESMDGQVTTILLEMIAELWSLSP